jgi:hypothetical protein
LQGFDFLAWQPGYRRNIRNRDAPAQGVAGGFEPAFEPAFFFALLQPFLLPLLQPFP